MPGFVPPGSAMGFHGYQAPQLTGYNNQTLPGGAPQQNTVMPPLAHQPNSYPSSLQPGHASALPFTPPVPSASAPAVQPLSNVQPQPPGPGLYQQQQHQQLQPNPTGQGRPLPDQPHQAPLTFPNAMPYNHNPNQSLPGSGHTSPQPVNSVIPQATPPAPANPGFIPPPPPPPIGSQAHRASSLPPAPGSAPNNNNNTHVNGTNNLPTPPHHNPNGSTSISANNTGGSGSGRPGLPLPPLPNPPGQQQQQSAFFTGQPPITSSTPLPGPPPGITNPGFVNPMQGQQLQQQQQQQQLQQQQPLQGHGHMQQASFGSNVGYNGQPVYNGQQQQGLQYQNQPLQTTPWQQQQQQQQPGLQPSYLQQQYGPGQLSHTPVPQPGLYPYPPQAPTPWH
ncbi:hypothetical protein M408DRAFT_30999 [Serendipita vermifera MAFF 305830]|uniref:Uncharacterized protein n=1 Tax=Serendipita vermifera MAFF 305830 TaxID=933852 RepID=A0A0C2WPZ7_SERVB|nr:hypothetical protein M408DRAFT_30999 [Serendipita vermifera MAFF 305830]